MSYVRIFSFPELGVDLGVVSNSAPPTPLSLALLLCFPDWLESKTLLCNSMMSTSCPQSSSKPPSISSSLEPLDLPRPSPPPPSFPPEAYCDTRANKRQTPAFSCMLVWWYGSACCCMCMHYKIGINFCGMSPRLVIQSVHHHHYHHHQTV